VLAASTLLTLFDPSADPERRMDAALLISTFMMDVAYIRRIFVEIDSDG
jgi:hypothetical protein